MSQNQNCEPIDSLPDGAVIRISPGLGPEARGCRLDPAAPDQAVAIAGPQLARGAELLLLNKFGKHEADGRGCRNLIGAALAHGLPVLTGVEGLNRAAFEALAEGAAELLPADPAAILAWVRRVRMAVAA